jgi:hypothetical protein
MFRKVCLIFCVAVSWLYLAGSAGAASVELFSPERTVKDVRQVTVRFTDQMVAFGDPGGNCVHVYPEEEYKDPFRCAADGQEDLFL